MSLAPQYPAKSSATGRPVSHAAQKSGGPERNLFSYEYLISVRPGFKNFCRPTIDGKVRPLSEILAASRKAEAAKFRAFCKPKGVYSILKDGEFTTGRMIRYGKKDAQTNEMDWYDEEAEMAKFKKIDGEWVSVVDEPSEGVIVETVSQETEALWKAK